MKDVLRCWGLALLVGGGQAQAAEPLRMVSDAWPPFTSRELPNDGLATAIVREVLAHAGYRSRYYEVPWARVLYGVQRGDYDLVINARYTEERERYGLFSDAYLYSNARFLRRVGSGIGFAGLDSLRPHSIAVVRGYAYAPAFDRKTDLQRLEVKGFRVAARMLAAGRVQLSLEDERVADYHFQRDLRDIRDQLEFVDPPLARVGLHILVRRSHPQADEIVRRFNASLRALQADGSYRQLFIRQGEPLSD